MKLNKIRYLLTIFLSTVITTNISCTNINCANNIGIEDISEKVLKNLRKNDKEFSDYDEIENATNEGDLAKLREKIEEFRSKYILSSYQNIFPLLEIFCTYKTGEDDKDKKSKLNIDNSKMSDDTHAYLLYIHSLLTIEEAKDSNFAKSMFGKELSAPEYGINPEHNKIAANFCKNLLKDYPQSSLSFDAEKRLFEIERLIATNLLEKSLEDYEKGNYISSIQDATSLLSILPHRRESIQALLIIYASYIKIHIYDLAEPFKEMYILNRHQLVPFLEQPNLESWFSIAEDFPFCAPDSIDKEGYILTTKLVNILNRLDKNFQDNKNYNTKYELLSEEEKKSKDLKEIKNIVIRWISLKRRVKELNNDINILKKLDIEYKKLCDFGEELSELGYEPLTKINFKEKSLEFNNSLDIIEKTIKKPLIN